LSASIQAPQFKHLHPSRHLDPRTSKNLNLSKHLKPSTLIHLSEHLGEH
jgi:hypothetical protein